MRTNNFINALRSFIYYANHLRLAKAAFLKWFLSPGMLIPFILIVLLIVALIVFLFYQKLRRRKPESKFSRGTKIEDIKICVKEAKSWCEKNGAEYGDLIKVGNVPVTLEDEPKHFFIIGRPDMGKSAAMCQAFDVIKKRGKKCVCYDVKYSFINKFYDPLRDLIYSPGDRKSFSWNFFNELAGSDFEVRAKIDIITKSLVPENERAIDKYWVTSPREVLYAIILYLHLGGRDNLTELKKMISQDIGVVYDALLSCPETMSKAAYINPKNDRTSHSTWTTLLSYLGFLDYLQEQRSDFRLSDWIENDSQENGQTIFLSDYGSARPFMPLSTLFIDLAAFYISKLPDTKGPDRTRVYFFIDEFGALNPMLSIVDLIKLYRSKGASVWVTSQDFSQIAEKYGMLQTTITDSCASQFYFSVGDETANMLERMIGAAEYEESDVHANIEGMGIKTDHTINRSFRTKPAVLAGEIKRMEKLNFIVKMNGRYFRGFINGKDLEKFADREIGFESI